MLKLPSSLNWLIKRRGRIDGSIQKIERYLDDHRNVFVKYQELTSELLLLKETLSSIDTTIRLHELQIDPENIPTINGKNYLTDLPRGELTSFIFERVGMAFGQPVSSAEIVNFVLQRRKSAGLPPMVKTTLSIKVGKRLKALGASGELIRHHSKETKRHGWWTLTPISQDTRLEDGGLDYNP